MDIIENIFNWNDERGLLEKGYNKELEASFISEELSELLRGGDDLVEAVDAHIDSIIFQVGALSKILKSPEAVHECFNAVLLANEQKGKKCDKDGKVIKNKDVFVEPQDVIKRVLSVKVSVMSIEGQGLHEQASMNKNTSEIISDFSIKSKLLFLVVGFEHIEIMKLLGVNYMVFRDRELFESCTLEIDYTPYFIGLLSEFEQSTEDIGFIDLEVLKAIELIPPDELSQNDFEIGLELAENYTLKDYVEEVKQEGRCELDGLYLHMSALLQRACFVSNVKTMKRKKENCE